MTNKFEKLAQLKELESLCLDVTNIDGVKWSLSRVKLGELLLDGDNVHWLLDVANAFRSGDAIILKLFVEFVGRFNPDGHLDSEGDGASITNRQALACLKRLQTVAEMMEQ